MRLVRRAAVALLLATLAACSGLPQPSISTPGLPAKERLGNGPNVVGVVSFSEPNNLAGGTADASYLAAKLAISTASGLPTAVELRNGAAIGPRSAAEQMLAATARLVILPRDPQAVRQAEAVLSGKGVASVSLSREGAVGQARYGAGFSLEEEAAALAGDIRSRGGGQVLLVTSKEVGSDALAAAISSQLSAAGLSARLLPAEKLGEATAAAAPAIAVFATSPELAANTLLALPIAQRTSLQVYGNAEWALALPAPAELLGARFAAPSDNLLRDFSRRFTAAYSQRPTLASALVYDLTIMAAALPAAIPSDPFGQQALLAPEGFRGFTGSFAFGGHGVAQPRPYSIFMVE